MHHDSLFPSVQSAMVALQKAAKGPGQPLAILTDCGETARLCVRLLCNVTETPFGDVPRTHGGAKRYSVYESGGHLSRPVLDGLFVRDPDRFRTLWDDSVRAASAAGRRRSAKWDATFYTAVMALACVYDLHARDSRKTPATFFEIAMSALLGAVTGWATRKHIPLSVPGAKVTTDLVLLNPDPAGISIAVPLKITTRERIYQVLCHQRILDQDPATKGRYRTVFIGVSEMQRDRRSGVKEICVPGQILVYHRYVAEVQGFYYLDPPEGYLGQEFTTGALSDFLTQALPPLMS